MKSVLRALKRDLKRVVLITISRVLIFFYRAVLKTAKLLCLIKFVHGMVIFPTHVLCGNQIPSV